MNCKVMRFLVTIYLNFTATRLHRQKNSFYAPAQHVTDSKSRTSSESVSRSRRL